MSEIVRFKEENGIAILDFDDGKANVFNTESVESLRSALRKAKESKVKALVLRGRQGFFSCGLDLKVLPSLSRDQLNIFLKDYFSAMSELFLFPRPTVALCNGHALAGGCIMLLCCDYRIGPKAPIKVGLNETQIGIAMPRVATLFTQSRLQPRHINKAILFGKVMAVEEALEVGYFDEIDEVSDTEQKAFEMAAQLGKINSAAYSRTKNRIWKAKVDTAYNFLEEELKEAFLPENLS